MTAKKAKQTPRKTSSPVRRSPRLAAEKEDEEDLEDTIISGVNFANVREKMREAAAGAVARSALGDVTNNAKARHKERVEEAASPMLPRREADDDNSNKENPPTTPKSAMKAPSSNRTEVQSCYYHIMNFYSFRHLEILSHSCPNFRLLRFPSWRRRWG